MSDTALINRCMDILRESVGVVNAEKFVYIMRTDAFDYTEWQREYFDTIAPDELDALVDKHSKEHPFKGKKAVIMYRPQKVRLKI